MLPFPSCTELEPAPNDVSSGIKTVQSRDPALTWALGRHLLRLLGRPEEDRLARWAAATHADALHVHDVLRVLIQVPQCTGARGGVHLLDEPPHADVLLLQVSGRGPAAKNATVASIGAQPQESVAAEISSRPMPKRLESDLLPGRRPRVQTSGAIRSSCSLVAQGTIETRGSICICALSIARPLAAKDFPSLQHPSDVVKIRDKSHKSQPISFPGNFFT